MSKRILIAVFLLGALLSGSVAYYVWPTHHARPDNITLLFSLPPNTDLYPSSAVQPGTFKINIPLQELFSKSRSGEFGRTIVTYDNFVIEFAISYWLARGDGAFYYSQHIKGGIVPGPWFTTKWSIQESGLVAEPQNNYAFSAVFIILFILFETSER